MAKRGTGGWGDPPPRGGEPDPSWRYVAALPRAPHVSDPPSADDDPVPEPGAAAAADARVIRDFRSGRPEGVEALAARLAIVPRILGGLCRRLRFPMPPHDLEDVAQDAVLIALRKLGELPPGVPLDAWLHRLCNYELANALRRRFRRVAEALPVDLPGDAAAAIQQLERRELLFHALEQLPPAAAHIVRLHQLEGRTLAELAAQLGLTENTVKGRYYRAIDRLTSILRNHRPGREER
jgi:RNA polymerase sigma-70 factor, ECF subfamily